MSRFILPTGINRAYEIPLKYTSNLGPWPRKSISRKKKGFLKNIKSIFLFISGNYTLGSPGGHSTTGLFVNSGLPNGHGGPNGHHNSSSNNGPISFLNGGTSLANLGLMTNNSHLPPNIQNQSPTSVLSNYSLNRNLNQLNLNLVPRNNR